MYRNLMAALGDRWRPITHNLTGFGYSSTPSVDEFGYTFATSSGSLQSFVDTMNLDRHVIWLHDYGSQFGFQLALARPENEDAYDFLKGSWNHPGPTPGAPSPNTSHSSSSGVRTTATCRSSRSAPTTATCPTPRCICSAAVTGYRRSTSTKGAARRRLPGPGVLREHPLRVAGHRDRPVDSGRAPSSRRSRVSPPPPEPPQACRPPSRPR